MELAAAAVLFGFILLKLCDAFDLRTAGVVILLAIGLVAWRDPEAFSEGLLAFVMYEAKQLQQQLQPLVDRIRDFAPSAPAPPPVPTIHY